MQLLGTATNLGTKMEYCKKCKKLHRSDKTMFQVSNPATIDSVADFLVHLARKHGLVDVKFGFGPLNPDTLIKMMNSKDKLSRKEKKALKRLTERMDF